MCGILWHYKKAFEDRANQDATSSGLEDPIFDEMASFVLERGGDSSNRFTKTIKNGIIKGFSSVLSIRAPLTVQPMVKDNFVLQYNGELYNQQIKHNDLQYIQEILVQSNFDIETTIAQLDGEFAYCITNTDSGKVYFGKDLLGRKSLGYMLENDQIYISSCPPPTDRDSWTECLCATIYVYDVKTGVLETVDFNTSSVLPIQFMVQETDQDLDIIALHSKLAHAVRKRVTTISPPHPAHSNLALLFSGGLDCTLLAALAAKELGPGASIDLLNVSFNNPRSNTLPANTPDRLLAHKSWIGLKEKYPEVNFELVEVDVPYEEYLEHRSKVIQLIYPNDTEMDLSIAIAFYFAARGSGQKVGHDGVRIPYESTCKVLLSGLGADELFGGYTRHERIFTGISNQLKRKISGKPQKDTTEYDWDELMSSLKEELQLDLSNLHTRNLSRDDKVISCWSKEVRYPFLDDEFVGYATTEVKLEDKLQMDRFTGEIIRKFALRKLAQHLELDFVENEPKRAIQFGSRSAKMDPGAGKIKGTDHIDVK
ncbi:hypothetical protein OGAPHI_001796 [Ogataea philodendri]|uniref:Glutamine amidotransferase type-2 domain-containing protein n=1 Tax=Ogataea philodendri TaxID=1378263 RepID=A0A9P8P9T7_9ASCO|nr:uncharacterized protein OGAPHI_001796 [Ogataea philodendri]KAH3668042.1 hypothetical protein OGAPHI_001796 [Ogataea philodendri]